MAARNEAGYIEVTLRTLIEEGLEVVLIDNGSVDGTRELAEPFLGGGLLEIRDAPWRGSVDLAELLTLKQDVYQAWNHEWQMHVDADEWPRATDEATLAESLGAIPPRFIVVDFRELVFIPPVNVDMWGQDYRRAATRYYAFQRPGLRLMRAWRRDRVGSNVESGGHAFRGVATEAIYSERHILRHYIGLSWSHAIAKRADRSYPAHALERGWHKRRQDLRAARPVVESPHLREADPWDTRDLDVSRPTEFHFWEAGFHETIPTTDRS